MSKLCTLLSMCMYTVAWLNISTDVCSVFCYYYGTLMMQQENDTPTYTQYFPFAFCYYGTEKYLQFNGGGSL